MKQNKEDKKRTGNKNRQIKRMGRNKIDRNKFRKYIYIKIQTKNKREW